MPSLNPQLQGREYWRSLQQLSDSPEMTEAFAQEFHGYNPEGITQASRRDFMKIMGAAMALAGLTLTGCRRWPEQEIRPHANQPEGVKPGVPLHYASILPLAGVATGLLIKSYDGRPIKVEGNALHPYSLGAADCFAQASVLDVYDPDRSRFPFEQTQGKKRQRSWDDFADLAKARFSSTAAGHGERLAVLVQASSSPTLDRLRQQFIQQFPQATWCVYEPIHSDHEFAGTRLAYGQPLRPIYHLDKARVIVSFDADLLGLHPAHQKHARDWADGRRSADQGRMNRLHIIESDMSITGSVADHRLPLRPSAIPAVLLALAAKLGIPDVAEPSDLSPQAQKFVASVVADLQAQKGRSLLTAGASLAPEYQALVHRINDHLGNTGKTVSFIAPPPGSATDSLASIASLTQAMQQGKIDTLLMLGGNPVYNAPADLSFAQALSKVELSIHLSQDVNETSLASRWHLPMAHYLECWGDGQAWDGTLSVQQPLILPIFNGKSDIEVLAIALGLPQSAGLDLVRDTLKPVLGINFENRWRQLLHDGLLPNSAAPKVAVNATRSPGTISYAKPQTPGTDSLEVRFIPSAATYDGRFANNGWLQETPDPLTKVTWDNPALISKADADRLHIKNGDLLKLTLPQGASLEIAALIQPGLAQGTLVLPLGYGRQAAGNVGTAIGFDTYVLRTTRASYIVPQIAVAKTGRTYQLAATQEHHLIDGVGVWGRDKRIGQQGESGYLIREATLDQYRQDRKVFHRNAHGDLSLQLFDPPHPTNQDEHAWGMAIDMNSCIGCNACTVACQAENNIPIVGKEQVATHREMHWLRIDRYFKHDPKTDPDVQNPDVVYAPIACVHCENAPCEQVCPVAATVHDSEGLNTMVYNRCIGTRYCSNNCPYKVRRFNYFDYHSKDPRGMALPWLNIPDTQQNSTIDQIKQMIYNPQVTVRMRGVMEKCTYCVQRIQEAKITAKVQHAQGQSDSDRVQDGQVVTACQSACPTQAIVFGNLNDPKSKVAMIHSNNRAYAMLEELNIRPRTKHLAKVRNPATT